MGKYNKSLQAGLSTVELLVTLLVAGLFIAAGYSLYTFVLNDSSTARTEAKATTLANEYLERYRVSSNTCTASNPLTNSPLTVAGLTNVTVTVVISCPDSTNTATTKVEVTVSYNNPPKTIQVASYAGPETSDVQDYLIGYSFPPSTPTTPVFYWKAIPGATNYDVKYKVNGGSWSAPINTTATTYSYSGAEVFRNDTVTIQVFAKNATDSLTPSKAVTATVPAWTKCPLQNEWTDYHLSWSGAEFTKTSTGVVMMRGLIKDSTPDSGEVVCNLPAGFRPNDGQLVFFTATGSTTAGRMDVATNGNLIYYGGNGAWESLSAITFMTGSADWQTPTASNGWVNYDGAGGYADVKYKVDALGRVQLQGLAKSGSYTGYATVAYTLTGYAPSAHDIHPSYPCATTGSFTFRNDAVIVPRNLPGNGCWSLPAILYSSSYTGVGGWQYPTPPAGWSNYGSGFANAGYIKSSDGIVSLRGLIVNASNGETLFTLPSGYRPNKTILCYVVTSPETFARVDVGADGTVVSREGTNATWLSLAGCNFMAEQ